MILSEKQKQQYARDGFLVMKNFVSASMCQLLMDRAHTLIDGFVPKLDKTVFSTVKQSHANAQYFLDSGDKIHFFFEEHAFDAQGELKKDKHLSINKIGHALHDLDPVFDSFSRQHKNAALINDLGVSNPLLLQSMYICKQPYIGGEVTCHQDNTYLYMKEQTVIGLWFALEDATVENGCMWAIPGGHNIPLKSRAIRKDNRMITETYDPTPWPEEKLVPLEVPRGSVIVLHGLLPHMSKENTSPRSRHAYSLHIVSGDYDYAADNWLQRPKDNPLRGFLDISLA